jgi:chemotaxis protein histidine kinase CheA
MKHRKITKDEINKITQISPPRERAFFTIMRQSGLPPHRIKELKIGDVEGILDPNPPRPCKINALHESPNFIGEEGVKHLKEYLDKRSKEKLTTKSLLFTARNKPNREINTKRVSITFKEKAIKIGKPDELKLYSLIEFYKNNTEDYQKELKELNNDTTPKDDEFYRELYRKKAMRHLEIELQTPTDKLDRLEVQNKELTQRLTEIEDLLLPKESPEDQKQMEKLIEEHEQFEKWSKEHPEEKQRWEEKQKKHQKWLEEHPEEAKRIEEQMDAEAEQIERLYTEHLTDTLGEMRNKLKELEDIIRKHRRNRVKVYSRRFPPTKTLS